MKYTHRSARRLPAAAMLLFSFAVLPAVDADDVSAVAGHMLTAEVALDNRDYRLAAEAFRKAAELSDDPALARQAAEIGFVYGFNGDALLASRRWAELADDSEEARLYIARIQMRRGKYRAAQKGFKRLIQGERAEDRLLVLIAVLLEEDPVEGDRLMRALTRP